MPRYSYKCPSSFALDAGTLLLIEKNNVNIHIIMVFRNYLSMQCFSIERNVANAYQPGSTLEITIEVTTCMSIDT